MPVTAASVPNIAFIKYWGNRDDELRLCAADSVSMCLNTPHVEVTLDWSEKTDVKSFEFDGKERTMTMQHLLRFQQHIDLTKRYLTQLGLGDAIPQSLTMTLHSGIPPAIGLASSSAVFSCIAEGIAGLVRSKARELTRTEVSVIARLGSGSAARSVFGGYVAIDAGETDSIDSAVAVQIADENHWVLHDIIIVPTHEEKKYGSTEGHSYAKTSPLFAKRVADIMDHRQAQCIDAIKRRDFELLQKVAEEDCLDMHQVMKTSTPPLHYLTEDTYRIIDEIEVYRRMKHLPVLYTMDAGPTVHLFCTDEAKDDVLHFAHMQQGCTVFVAKTGHGSHMLDRPHR